MKVRITFTEEARELTNELMIGEKYLFTQTPNRPTLQGGITLVAGDFRYSGKGRLTLTSITTIDSGTIVEITDVEPSLVEVGDNGNFVIEVIA